MNTHSEKQKLLQVKVNDHRRKDLAIMSQKKDNYSNS